MPWEIGAMKDIAGYLTPEQVKRMTNTALKEGKNRDYLLMKTMWMTGRRITEVLRLRVKDINLEDNRVIWSILKKKNRDMRKIKGIPIKLRDKWEWYIEEMKLQPDDRIFPITRQRAFQIVRRYAEKAGIYQVGDKQVHPHHFRHSFAVNFIKNVKTADGVPLLQRSLEHSNIEMTTQYLQFDATEENKILDKVFEND